MMARSRRYERRRYPKGSAKRTRGFRRYLSPRGKLEDKIEEILGALASAAADEAIAYHLDEFAEKLEEMRVQETRIDALSKRIDELSKALHQPPRPPGPLWKKRKR